MMKKLSRQKEYGVVLLSCLVFLLMLLALLKFTMSSAKMEEIKAGADYDQMSAKEAASITMMDAEHDIKRMKPDGTSLEDPTVKGEEKAIELAIQYWADPSKFAGRKGVYNGDDPASITCKTAGKPIYESCIDSETECSSTSNAICYGSQTGTSTIPESQGKYIIERFMGNGGILKMGGNDANTVILRVTAVGFSKPNKNGDNTSKVILQNTYILSGGRN